MSRHHRFNATNPLAPIARSVAPAGARLLLWLCLIFVPVQVSVAQRAADFVPQDTIAYLGTPEPLPAEMLIQALFGTNGKLVRQLMEIFKVQLDDGDSGSPVNKLSAVANGYADFLDDPKRFVEPFGVNLQKLDFALYFSGINPVMRIAVEDIERLKTRIEHVETEFKLSPRIVSQSGAQLRLYGDAEADSGPGVAIATDDNFAVLAISMTDEIALFKALGLLEQPAALRQSGKLQALQTQHSYTGQLLGYLDMRQIVRAITRADNDTSLQLAEYLDSDDVLDVFRTPPCQLELGRLADVCPRIVTGLTELNATPSQINVASKAIVEIDQPAIVNSLRALRGHIAPALTGHDAIAALGIGIDFDQIGLHAGKLASMFADLEYECPALQLLSDIPDEIIQQGILGLTMSSGMMRGVRGFNAALFDVEVLVPQQFDGELDTLKIDSVDAAITLDALDPHILLAMARMIPAVASFQFPVNNEAVDVSQQIAKALNAPIDFEISLEIQDDGIVSYAGETATHFAAERRSEKDIEKNGVFHLSIDLDRYKARFLELAKTTMLAANKPTSQLDLTMDEQMSLVSSFYTGGRFQYTLDFSEHGIEFGTAARINAP